MGSIIIVCNRHTFGVIAAQILFLLFSTRIISMVFLSSFSSHNVINVVVDRKSGLRKTNDDDFKNYNDIISRVS